jgi:hypothetical protein
MKQFKSKSELFAYLVANRDELITAKKAETKRADPTAFVSVTAKSELIGAVNKGKYRYENDEEAGKLIRTIVANTYNYMDSHDDVHLDGVFSKSLAESAKKVRHLKDHDHSLATGKIGIPLGFEEKSISWRELGLGKTGMTQALFMQSEIRKDYNDSIYRQYLADEIDQHSVGMQYVKLELAVNEPDDYPNEYRVWEQHIGKIGNRAAVEDQGFFFAVSEAKLLEVSAVLMASNELTPTLGNKTQPEKFTVIKDGAEPAKATRVLKELQWLNYELNKIKLQHHG